MKSSVIFLCVVLIIQSSHSLRLRQRSKNRKRYEYFGSCFDDMTSLRTSTSEISPIGAIVPIVAGKISTSSSLPGSNRFMVEDERVISGPENYGVLNGLHFSVFEGQDQAESCESAPFFTVKVSDIVDLKPSFGGDFMPSAERSSYCFKLYTKLARKPASICASTREERSLFSDAIKTQIRLSNSLKRSPSGVLSSEEIDELAKERVKSYLLGEGITATDEQLPSSGEESESVVFPPAKGSICAFNGNICLSSLPASLNESDSIVSVVAQPAKWASSYPHPIASRRQRWRVIPSEEDGGVRICAYEKWNTEASCLSLPAGQIEDNSNSNVEAAPSSSGDLMLETDCSSSTDTCVTIFEQTAGSVNSMSLEEILSPCVEMCDESTNCKAWTHVAADTDGAPMAKCCTLTSNTWSENCATEKDGFTSGPRQSEAPVQEGESDGTALTTPGSSTRGNLIFAKKDSSSEQVIALQVWSVDGVDRNVANIRIAAGDGNLCVTTKALEEKETYSTVWSANCDEDEENPNPSQLWVFTGFFDEEEGENSSSSSSNDNGLEFMLDGDEGSTENSNPPGLRDILREAGLSE